MDITEKIHEVVAYLPVIGTVRKSPCYKELAEYEKCVVDHTGVAPEPYELEWCTEEKIAYHACREDK